MNDAVPSSRKRRQRSRKRNAPPIQQQTLVVRKSMWQALPSWLGLVLALSINFITVGYTYATFESKLERNKEEIIRNEREDRERASRFDQQLTAINNSIANMGQLKTDVEVMKNSLASINETLRRLERRFEQRLEERKPAPSPIYPP